MGAYIQTLIEGISPLVPDVPDKVQRRLVEIRDEAHSIGSWLITASRNMADCAGRAMSALMALRRHAWLRGFDLNSSVRAAIEDMLLGGSGLFHAETDERLNRKFRMKAAAKKHGMSSSSISPFRKRQLPWQPQGPVVRDGRPEGRLLPHRNSGVPQEIPRLRRRLHCVPLQRPPLWPCHGPEGLHQVHGASGGIPSSEGLQSLPVPGRLVVCRRLTAGAPRGSLIRLAPFGLPRTGRQRREVSLHSDQAGQVHRSHARLRKMLRLSPSRPFPDVGGIAEALHLPQKGESQGRPSSSGPHGVNDVRDTVGKALPPTTAVLVPLSLLSDGGPPVQVAHGTETGGRFPEMVAGLPQRLRRDALPSTSASID
ncbi:uncharacterized protein LOC121920715 [Sceloporus undulatus]|uniref:uncharacterized protein LOC121920715 n=1 Tax=Sceloporus undulatus TaxID=8520 RepID=UPI001C4ACD57|nr:uncharacterized protein LOC121920715 [Sceloporus undulatus]